MKTSFTPVEIKVSYHPDLDDRLHPKVTSSKDAFTYLMSLWDLDTLYYRECFVVLFLNYANRILGYSCVSMGTMHTSTVDPRIIFAIALKCGARGIILYHNHPSRSPKPSSEDIRITEKISMGAKCLDLQILDHVIIYGTQEWDYYSFADNDTLS